MQVVDQLLAKLARVSYTLGPKKEMVFYHSDFFFPPLYSATSTILHFIIKKFELSQHWERAVSLRHERAVVSFMVAGFSASVGRLVT